jgi:hypothetical protein
LQRCAIDDGDRIAFEIRRQDVGARSCDIGGKGPNGDGCVVPQ